MDMEQARDNICELKMEVARLDERIKASDKALELARSQVSRASVISGVTLIISIVAIVVQFIKH